MATLEAISGHFSAPGAALLSRRGFGSASRAGPTASITAKKGVCGADESVGGQPASAVGETRAVMTPLLLCNRVPAQGRSAAGRCSRLTGLGLIYGALYAACVSRAAACYIASPDLSNVPTAFAKSSISEHRARTKKSVPRTFTSLKWLWLGCTVMFAPCTRN